MAEPDRPDPDDIISSTWGRWVQDTLDAQCGEKRVAADISGVAAGWGKWALVTLPAAPAGTYLAIASLGWVNTSVNDAAHLAILKEGEGFPTGALMIGAGMGSGSVNSGTVSRLITHPGGALAVGAWKYTLTAVGRVVSGSVLTVSLVSTASPTAQAATRPGEETPGLGDDEAEADAKPA